MRKPFLGCCLSIVFFLSFYVSLNFAHAFDKHHDYDKLSKKMTHSSTPDLRVIVELKSAHGTNNKIQTTAEIYTSQSNLINTLKIDSFADVKRLTYFPIVAMKVSSDGLNSVYNHSSVIRIFEDTLEKTSQVENIDRPQLWDSAEEIQAPELWAQGYFGEGQAIAVLDTGVRTSHEMFRGRVLAEACFNTNDLPTSRSVCPNGFNRQIGPGSARPAYRISGHQHGTHVSGIALGDSNRGFFTDPDGIAHRAKLIAINVFTRFNDASICGGSPPCLLAYISDQMRALDYVYGLRNKHKIVSINMSLGGGKYAGHCDSSQSRTTIVNKLHRAGIVVVAATGNSGYANRITAPACISKVVAVGSVSTYNFISDRISSFSNSSWALDLLAPGNSIYSADTDSNTDYTALSGTSMATPHVAGAYALLKAARKKATITNIEAALKSTGIQMRDSRNGIRRSFIQLEKALARLPFEGTSIMPFIHLLLLEP